MPRSCSSAPRRQLVIRLQRPQPFGEQGPRDPLYEQARRNDGKYHLDEVDAEHSKRGPPPDRPGSAAETDQPRPYRNRPLRRPFAENQPRIDARRSEARKHRRIHALAIRAQASEQRAAESIGVRDLLFGHAGGRQSPESIAPPGQDPARSRDEG